MNTLPKRASILAIVLVSMALFFPLATSEWPNEYKLPLIVVLLYASGEAIRRVSGLTGYGPVILWKGKGGFSIMRKLAKDHPRLFGELNDFGLTLCFGIPYSFYVFPRQWKKLAIHAVLVALVFWGLQLSVVPQFDGLRGLLYALGLAGGLLGFGLSFTVLHALTILSAPTTTPAGVVPVVPGITIPFVEGLIAIFIAAVVHELSHGIIALAEKLRLKSSGGLFLSFLPIGAFVEPDEEQFKKAHIHKKRRVLVAGSASNFAVFVIALILLTVAAPVLSSTSEGLTISNVLTNGTAAGVLSEGDVLLSADGQMLRVPDDLKQVLDQHAPGQQTQLSVRDRAGGLQQRQVTIGPGHKLGIYLEQEPAAKPGLESVQSILAFLARTIGLTGFLNFALSTVNLLPLFITDGHRLLQEELLYRLGPKREHVARLLAKVIGFATLAILLINALPLVL